MKIKFILLTVFSIWLQHAANAQCPQSFYYQAVVRDAAGNGLPNLTVTIRFTILDSNNPGVPVYQEDHQITSNIFGQIIPYPGRGTPRLGTFPAINWATGHKYMRVEMDATGGSLLVNMGTELLGSVPYALYADSAAKGGYPQHHIGEHYGGGIIFYVSDNGQHGLIADSADLQTGNDTVTWANVDTITLNANLPGTGGGIINTERIVVKQGAGNYAANLCANDTSGGYGDWFLPSANELALLYQQQQVVGGFGSAAPYWSSTESSARAAQAINFASGATVQPAKSSAGNVRAVRAF